MNIQDNWVKLYDTETGENTVDVQLTDEGYQSYLSGGPVDTEQIVLMLDVSRMKLIDFS